MTDFYTVIKGDTLWKIAKEHGTTTKELKAINGIDNQDKLFVGQKLALKKQAVLGVQPLFLDHNRDPIEGLNYILEYAGKVVNGITSQNGLGKKIFTNRPDDEVKIFVQRIDGSIKKVGNVISDYGNKLVTLISPSVKVTAPTDHHPEEDAHGNEKNETAYNPKAKQKPTTEKKDLGVTTMTKKDSAGKPVAVVKGDIPDLSFLGEYVGGEITKEDIDAAAKDLNCEPGLIYAIAKQESAHSSFIKIGERTVPTILYERHWFRKLTAGKQSSSSPYEEKYYDICGPAYHTTKKVTKEKTNSAGKKISYKEIVDSTTGKAPVAEDMYGNTGMPQYKRLSKAYQLDKSAALQSCSWGKFQIMGFNFKSAGYSDVFSFVKAMCSGEPAHIVAFLKFAKSNKTLLSGLREKKFEKIAEGHNGASWKTVNPNYAKNLEEFYAEYTKK